MRRALYALALVLHVVFQLAPAIQKVSADNSGRDFSSYYYAAAAATHGKDPYDTAGLSKLSRKDHTRRGVNPYFYPPPFVLTMLWAPFLTLHQAYWAMLVLNEVLLAACLAALYRWFAVPTWALALLVATYSPIPDNAWMGQANLLALLPALIGLGVARATRDADVAGGGLGIDRRRDILGGALVGFSAMLKMSPALFLLYWALRRNWTAIGMAVVTAVALSVAALPFVTLSQQIVFYCHILPGFASGDYHGLTVPISLPANHSIPDLWNRLFPSGGDLLSERARVGSLACTLTLIGVWAWVCRKRGNEPAVLGALTVIMVVTPVYTYEHHLVFLLLALGAAARVSPAFGLTYFFLAWSLVRLRQVQGWAPDFVDPWLRESKFLAELSLFGLCLWRHRSEVARAAHAAPTYTGPPTGRAPPTAPTTR